MKKVDRVGVICELFSHAYYSFLPVSHVLWRQTEDMISLYWESMDTKGDSIVDNKGNSMMDVITRMEEMQARMLKEIEQHPAFRLPVSGK